jgi:AraC-like DNA-binding protein
MNKTIYFDEDKNSIRYSQIKNIEAEIQFTGLGVKYVASGSEIYHANGKKFIVKEGEYIIGNDFTSSIVKIDQEEAVHGLCIDISSQIISEVSEFHDLSGTDLKEFLLSDQFFVNRYNVKNTTLGYTLQEINRKIQNSTIRNDLQRNELFYSLAESIVTDQRFIFEHLNKMDFKKVSTNEEIFRALLTAKNFIDENLLEELSLDQICLQAGLSKYHFIRLFKSTFGISPYQYLKRKLLELAKKDLISGKTVSEVYAIYGFSDVAAFSKGFKQQFGIAPSKLNK